MSTDHHRDAAVEALAERDYRAAGDAYTRAGRAALAAPRGTTEYDNDEHHCPARGSTDVSWTGGTILCLRCSAPVERR